MQCPKCGFARAGETASCPSCGSVFRQPGPVPASRPEPRSQLLFRIVVYALIFFGLAHFFGYLYSQYLDAEAGRLEAGLLGQVIRHKKMVQEAAQEAAAAAEAGGES